MTADEHAFERAQPFATQGLESRDCVETIAGIAAGPPDHKYRSQTVSLTVATSTADVTLTFPRGVGAAFDRIRIGDSVAMTSWRGGIVAATAQGDTELTPAAPSERYRESGRRARDDADRPRRGCGRRRRGRSLAAAADPP